MSRETSISEFVTGHGTADGVPRPIAGPRKLYKGVRIRANPTNTDDLYVGPPTLNQGSGFFVAPGSDLLVEVDDLSKVYLLASGAGSDEVQEIDMDGVMAGDTFRLTFQGETTTWTAVGSDPATVEPLLEALTTIGAGNVTVGGLSLLNGTLTVTFAGDLAGTNVDLITAQGGTNAEQQVSIDPATTGGTFLLTFDGETTGAISYDAANADVQAALEALPNIGAGNVLVGQGPIPAQALRVMFQGALSAQDVPSLIGDGSALTGGTTDVTVTEVTAGVSKTITVTEQTEGGPQATYSWIAQ